MKSFYHLFLTVSCLLLAVAVVGANAPEATEKYLAAMAEVFKKTGTVYENYMPEKIALSSGRGDFVGWTGLGPIALLIENVLGFRPDGVGNQLERYVTRTDRHGIKHLNFGRIDTDLLYDGNGAVIVHANAPYMLMINGIMRSYAGDEMATDVGLTASQIASLRVSGFQIMD
jgi:hypothetical protein